MAALTTDDSGKVLWDLANREGTPVASGVYLGVVEQNGSRKILKILVQK
ncbi:MAG: hypothetical protein IPP35_11770 [Elusimicrobia bacterium]|nr:hypothetical protein [Elusimicrobiota bacterium]